MASANTSMSSRLPLFVVMILFSTLLSTNSLAGTVYQYVDEDGAVCISDRPPEKVKKKTTVKETNYRDKTFQERAYNDAQEANRMRQWEAREEARQSAIRSEQRQRDMADRQEQRRQVNADAEREKQRLKAEAADRIQGIAEKKGMTVRQRETAVNAELIKIGEQPLPYSPIIKKTPAEIGCIPDGEGKYRCP